MGRILLVALAIYAVLFLVGHYRAYREFSRKFRGPGERL
jgi:hypothetical protein